MARALSEILTELDTTYNPLKSKQQEIYQQGVSSLEPQETADVAGLEQAKQDSFNQITTGANRRGLFYSGIPIAEQARYVGQTYLPSVANLKGRYAGLRGQLANTLAQALANLDLDRLKTAEGIRGREIEADLERERMAQEAASRAASGGGGISPSFTTVEGEVTSGWQSPLQQYLQQQYAKNPRANRATQDGWVNMWAAASGVDPTQAFAYYDTLYPWAQYNDRARGIVSLNKNTTPGGTTSLSGGSSGLRQVGSGDASKYVIGGRLTNNNALRL